MDKELWNKCIEFHGHECPGLAIGFRACEIAIKKINLTFSKDEELVCITENDACGVDAVQVITGCTMGKGNLIYRDTGKMAFSFFNRTNGDSIRLIMNNFQSEMSRDEKKLHILNAPEEEVFTIKKPDYEVPSRARIFNTIICQKCGEGVKETNIRLSNGEKLCLDCYEEYSRGW
ncbi:MAG: FmdE family protein [Vallitalea sp.]|jgi:formylmethanofuran dehydrogenase subunit E|nr:FmdE family protein [Vallitalea sp.]